MLSDSPNSAEDPVVSSAKSRLSPLIMVVVFVIAVLAFALGFIFSKKGFMVLPGYIPESVDIPLSYNSPSVYRASYVYAFNTKVLGIEEKDGKTILKTDLTGIDNLPEFVIDSNTKIFFVVNGIDFKTTKEVLKPGTPVYVYLSYNLTQKKWLTTRIATVKPDMKIKTLDSSIPPASVSGNTKKTK